MTPAEKLAKSRARIWPERPAEKPPLLTLEVKTLPQFAALYEALGQYQENQRDYVESLEPGDKDLPKAAENLKHVEDYIDQFSGLIAKLAEYVVETGQDKHL